MSNSGNTAPQGWYQDPSGQGTARYWNGFQWTESVDRAGVTVNVPIDPAMATVPPMPGTAVASPGATPQPAPVNVSTSSGGSPWGAIIGGLLVLVAVIVLIVFIQNDSSDDSPTPDTTPEQPAEQPAEQPPSSEGG